MGFFSIGPCLHSIILINRATLNLNQRPDIRAPVMEISLKNDSLITPGYIFMAPYQTELPGPYIYDTDGVS